MGVNAHEDEHEHCRHCDDTCRTTTGRGLHWGGRGAYWLPGACQACAEAERIAEAVEVEVSDAYSPAPDHYGRGYVDALTLAARIARGET